MKMRLILLVIVLAAFATTGDTSFAQASKPGAGNAGSSSSSTPVQPANPSTILNRDWNNIKRGGRQGDYLTGSVVLTGGALPWDPIPVSVKCDGKVSYTTATDPKGYFWIAQAEQQGSTTIKADAKPVATQYTGCSVEAALAGFDSNPLPIATRNVLDNPNIGTITLHREEGSGDAAPSSTSAAAPKDATKAFDKARSEWIDRKPDRAQKDLQKAVEIYPQYAEAWYQLGKLQEASKSPEAWKSFSKAVEIDPKFALPYEHMAPLAAEAGKWPELVDVTNRALALNPRGTLDIWYYNALGNFQTQKMDVAQTSAVKSLSMDPLHMQPNTEQMLAVILSQKGDTAGALEHLRNCLTYFAPGPNLELVKQQIAQLDPSAASK